MSYQILGGYCSHSQKVATDSLLPKQGESRVPKSSPTVFGPPTWAYLHISTAYLPENLNPVVAAQVRNTLYALPVMIPCETCSLHSGNYMTTNKERIESLKTGSDFFSFTVDLHNFVNKRLGKKVVSVAEARKMWT